MRMNRMRKVGGGWRGWQSGSSALPGWVMLLALLLVGGLAPGAQAQVDGGGVGMRPVGAAPFTSSTDPNPSFNMVQGITPYDYNGSNAFLSVTHPDVIYIPGGWQGYPYWMAYTPYPDAVRENPCIAVSRDGYSWANLPGNPIATYSEAVSDGYEWQADTDIILASNGTMQVYYMNFDTTPQSGAAVCRKVSTDGRTWGAREKLLTHTSATVSHFDYISPAVVVETNGNLTMFYCRQTSATMGPQSRMAWKESTDHGATWGGETICSYSTNRSGFPNPWHINVVKVGDYYYALVKHTANSTDYKQAWGWSTNKTDWQFISTPAFYNTGVTNFDYTGTYRNALVCRSVNPLRWDVWMSGVPRKSLVSSVPGVADANQPWLIGLWRDVTIPAVKPVSDFVVIPPASTLTRAAAATWFTANYALGNRFQLKDLTESRFVNFEIGVSSGNIEVGVVKFFGNDITSSTNRLIADTIATSGVIACPTAGNARVDLGKFYLGPGEYALYLWCDNTTATFYHLDNAAAGFIAGMRSSVFMTRAAASGYAVQAQEGWNESTDRAIAGITLSND